MYAAGVVMCSIFMSGCVTIGYGEPVESLKKCQQVIMDNILPMTERRVRMGAFPPDLYLDHKLCVPYKKGQPV